MVSKGFLGFRGSPLLFCLFVLSGCKSDLDKYLLKHGVTPLPVFQTAPDWVGVPFVYDRGNPRHICTQAEFLPEYKIEFVPALFEKYDRTLSGSAFERLGLTPALSVAAASQTVVQSVKIALSLESATISEAAIRKYIGVGGGTSEPCRLAMADHFRAGDKVYVAWSAYRAKKIQYSFQTNDSTDVSASLMNAQGSNAAIGLRYAKTGTNELASDTPVWVGYIAERVTVNSYGGGKGSGELPSFKLDSPGTRN